MISYKDDIATIVCDKCGAEESAPVDGHGKIFHKSGWLLNSKAKKYVHRCYGCRTLEEKRSHNFVKNMMG